MKKPKPFDRRWFVFSVSGPPYPEVYFNIRTAGPGMNLKQLKTFRVWLDRAIEYLEECPAKEEG